MAEIVNDRLSYKKIPDSDSIVTFQTLYIKATSKFVRVHIMKAYEGAEVQLHPFLNLALEGGGMFILHSCLFSLLD
jgi:hypothetical protein